MLSLTQKLEPPKNRAVQLFVLHDWLTDQICGAVKQLNWSPFRRIPLLGGPELMREHMLMIT